MNNYSYNQIWFATSNISLNSIRENNMSFITTCIEGYMIVIFPTNFNMKINHIMIIVSKKLAEWFRCLSWF